MATSVERWMCDELSKLGLPASEDNAKYILSIGNATEIQEYMLELLDGSDPKVTTFISQLIQKWRPAEKPPDRITVYRKSDQDDVYINGKNSSRSSKSSNSVQTKVKPSESLQREQLHQESKKTKFIPLFSQEGEAKSVIKLAGRHTCECQATKHKLIANCVHCGRIVCEQEGSGPCLFCGNLVCTKEEQEVLARGSRKSEQLRQRLMKDRGQEEYDKAVQHKNKLLEYDKTSVRRTQVIDDESDYFSTDNRWLSNTERTKLKKREEELRAQRHGSRKDRKVTLDFAGRRVVEDNDSAGRNMYDVNDDVIQEIYFGAKPKVNSSQQENLADLVNPSICVPSPKYVVTSSENPAVDRPHRKEGGSKRDGLRLQDRELQEMSDEGMCLSMHQPWASLLIKGIKCHEGRTWYTAHRGRLWIAATAKSPSPQEVAEVEQFYKYLYKDSNLQCPSHYPVGCLLGCADLTECLAQEEYKEKFPDGESGSPFVFICENPQELVVKFPIKGKHKIYKLENHILQAAKKGLR
ncbi:activating signal cointegrator 1-like [Ostrea edulis]|uniref:activating signal cointegrator 1-like n=1 Tax=Ostrea edulis TaxID=37623 RepID=UPI0024AF3499|nr:activating signal cointegrator 1-like [Ostrea edulis]